MQVNYKASQKMDVKQSKTTAASRKRKELKVVHFMGEVKQELKKVDWTTKEELKGYTKIVIASIFFFGMFVYFIDLIIQGVLGGVNAIVKFITG